MSEYIDRMLIISYRKSRRGNFIDDVGKGYDAGIASALRAVEKMPSSDVVPRDHNAGWISVNDRLPEQDGEYLCASTYSAINQVLLRIRSFSKKLSDVSEYYLGDKNHAGWYSYDSEYGYYSDDNVTHWMPLPEPPKEDEK